MTGLLRSESVRAVRCAPRYRMRPQRTGWQRRRRLCGAIATAVTAHLAILSAGAEKAAADRKISSAHQGGAVRLVRDLPGNVWEIPSDPEIWRFLRGGGRGITAVPDRKAETLIQSSGQRWRAFRNDQLPLYGKWGLAGMSGLLALFFAIRGRIRIAAWFSGKAVLRFRSIERFTHWLLATSFLVLAITGLNILYGRDVIKPLIGYTAFAEVTAYGKWLHDFTGFSFIVGLILILLLWARDNMPERCDLVWLARGGGLFSRGVHPPARRFNAGQKIIFWFVVLAGALVSFSGLSLLFPFTLKPFSEIFAALNLFGYDLPTDLSPLEEMQLTHAWHAVLGIVMIVVIIAHIYLGSIGMEGAFDAMATGYVDENWALEHHPLWAQELGLDAPADRGKMSENGSSSSTG